MYQPVDIYVGELGTAPLLISCEHATNRLPPDVAWPQGDDWLVETHWAWDPGAARLAEALADETMAVVVKANFSRLYVDPNRPLDHPQLFRKEADGRTVGLNQHLDETEKQARLKRCYYPYHEALARQARNRRGDFMLSIHSFAPEYEGQTRGMEVGIMHVDQAEAAEDWCARFCDQGVKAVVNQPYSGYNGFMHSVDRHAAASGRRAVMLEIRQDLIEAQQERWVALIKACLEKSGLLFG